VPGVVAHAVDDAEADHRCREGGDDQALEVVVAEPGGEHAAVLRLGNDEPMRRQTLSTPYRSK
jgi:hypothetical protein